MYTVSKGPSKIVAKTRRGLAQNYEKFETIKESGKRSDLNSPEKNIVPRPVFQTAKKTLPAKLIEEEVISPQHEEIIKYINDSWNIVVANNPYDSAALKSKAQAPKADSNNNNTVVTINTSATNGNSSTTASPVNAIYCIEPPSPVLSDFKPFDLESWWGRRLFNNITKNL